MSLDPDFPSEPGSDESSPIQFHSEEISFEFPDEAQVIPWIQSMIEHHKCKLDFLQIIFCSDPYLLKMNIDHLGHDYFTDIITFPYQAPPIIEGDLFISIDRVRDNAEKLGVSFKDELHRVIIHGVLHLCGYGDKTELEAKKMRALENEALDLRLN